MKRAEMIETKECRENAVGFLHHTDLAKLNALFGKYLNVSKQAFNDLCDKTLDLYENKQITNKTASDIYKILASNNSRFRTESHSIDATGSIYEYSEDQRAYLFMKKGTLREFNYLNRYL